MSRPKLTERVTIRLPEELLVDLTTDADRRGCSLNEVILHAVEMDLARQALDAIRQEIATWTIGTVPDLDVWAHGVAAWIAELPTDDLRTFWPGLLALDLHDHTGMTISRASLLIQRHVAARLARKEAWK